ncbi:MAG: carboxyl transferase domain-containing protein [Myxococcota bacterium]
MSWASKTIRADITLCFSDGEIAVMGPDGAVNVIFWRDIETSADPEKTRQEFVKEYQDNFANPYRAAELGYIDEVISPEVVRSRLIRALEMLRNKRDTNPPRKHGNIPL